MNTQTETKHTLGPWEVQRYRTHTGFSIWAGDRGCIAERWYDNQQQQPYGDEILANARLIAAAPELLEALRSVMAHGVTHAVGCSHKEETCNCHRSIASSAITKAMEGAQ